MAGLKMYLKSLPTNDKVFTKSRKAAEILMSDLNDKVDFESKDCVARLLFKIIEAKKQQFRRLESSLLKSYQW